MKELERIYNEIIKNETVFNKEFSRKLGKLHKLKISLFVILLLFKVFYSKIFSKKKLESKEKKIAFSWGNLHKERIKRIFPEIKIIDLSREKSLKSIHRYNSIKLSKLLKVKIKTDPGFTKFSNHSFFYKIYIALEYFMIEEFTKNMNNVIISGHFDRYSSIFSLASKVNNFKLSVVQHGCIQKYKENLNRIDINGDIYFMYDFSIPLFDTFLSYTDKTILYNQNLTSNQLSFSDLDTADNLLIVFACQDAKPENNLIIIDEVLRLRATTEFTMQILPHPREDLNYYKKYLKTKNVIISKEKNLRPNLFLTRFSTLGVEYHYSGIKTVFVNIDDVQMDFLLSKEFNVINKLSKIENYIKDL